MRYQRALADGENIRRRTQRCVEDAKIFGERFIHNKEYLELEGHLLAVLQTEHRENTSEYLTDPFHYYHRLSVLLMGNIVK